MIQRKEDCNLPSIRIFFFLLIVLITVALESISLFYFLVFPAILIFKELYWLALVIDLYLLIAFRGKNYSFFSPLQVMLRRIPRVLYSLALDL